MPTTFSGDLPRPLSGHSSTHRGLNGNVDCSRLLYTANVNPLSFFKDVKRHKLEAKGFEKREDLVRYNVRVRLLGGGGARIDNSLLKVTLRGEVTLVGTNAHMGLLGTVDVEEGGRGFFRGNEFVLAHGGLNFAASDRVAASLDLLAVSQVHDYMVRVHAFGPAEDPEVQFTSDPPAQSHGCGDVAPPGSHQPQPGSLYELLRGGLDWRHLHRRQRPRQGPQAPCPPKSGSSASTPDRGFGTRNRAGWSSRRRWWSRSC